MAVPITGGAGVVVASGRGPRGQPRRAVPRHGPLRARPLGQAVLRLPPDTVVVRDLVTGSEVSWGATQLSGLVPGGLHWQADSRRLVFRTTSKGDAAPVHWFVDVGAAFSAQSVGIAPEPPLPVVTPKSTWTIFDGPGPRLLAAAGPIGTRLPFPVNVVALDPQTGRTRVEFSVSPDWLDQRFALGTAGDDSGRRVALVAPSGELYLWNQGEPGYHEDGTPGFRRLYDGIDAVAWVPDAGGVNRTARRQRLLRLHLRTARAARTVVPGDHDAGTTGRRHDDGRRPAHHELGPDDRAATSGGRRDRRGDRPPHRPGACRCALRGRSTGSRRRTSSLRGSPWT